MCNNGREFLSQVRHLTPKEFVYSLAEVVIGRPVGVHELYVIDATSDGCDLTIELSDGSRFTFNCRKVE